MKFQSACQQHNGYVTGILFCWFIRKGIDVCGTGKLRVRVSGGRNHVVSGSTRTLAA